ncbi:syntaxin Pep12p [Monosporozyma servazzii]
MSTFLDYDGHESEQVGFSDSPQYDTLKDSIAEQLFEINGQIGMVKQFIASLSKFNNNGDIKAKYVERIDKKSIDTIHKIRKLIDTINVQVTNMNNIEESALDKARLISREKLNRDIKMSLQAFQNTQLEYTKVMKLINEKAQKQLNQNTAALRQEEEDSGNAKRNHVRTTKDHIFEQQMAGNTNQMVIEMDPINNEEFVYQQNLIRQRDEEIQNIEQGIGELHDIFRDLSTVVQQQGVLVDNIEANIYSTVDNTQKASKELHKAMISQRKQSKWCIYLLAILSIFLFFMFLVVLA